MRSTPLSQCATHTSQPMQSRVSIDSVTFSSSRLRGSCLLNLPIGLAVSRDSWTSNSESYRSNAAWLLISSSPGRRMRKTGWLHDSQCWRLSSFSRYLIDVLTTVACDHVRGLTEIGSFVYGLTC